MSDRDLALAKVGIFALIDEVTGYQEKRKPGALAKVLADEGQPPLTANEAQPRLQEIASGIDDEAGGSE